MLSRMLAGLAMVTCASWALCAGVGSQAGKASAPSSSGTVGSASSRLQAGTVVYDTRDPIVVDVETTPGAGCAPEFAPVAFAPPKAAAVVLLNVRGLPLRFDRLPPAARRCEEAAYETEFAHALLVVVADLRRRAPGCAVGVIGLPFEGAGAAASNERYAPVLERLAVMAPTGGVITGPKVDAGTALRGRFASSFADPAGRPVVFKGGTGWKVAATRAGGGTARPRASHGTGTSPGQPSAPDTPLESNQKSDLPESPEKSEGAPSPITVAHVLTGWGTSDPSADVDGDGKVNGADLAYALALNPDTPAPPSGGGDDGGGSGDPPADPLSPVLSNGSGFAGPTAQPPNEGDSGSEYYDCTAGARWSTVPDQTVDVSIAVGVVSFHAAGIARVEFSLDGGPWTPVATPRLNPQTSVFEFYAVVEPAGLADGPHEVRAIAFPVAGTPRVLPGLTLVTNANHSLPGGGTLYVANGGTDAPARGGTPDLPLRTLQYALDKMRSSLAAYDGGRIVITEAGEYKLSSPSDSVEAQRWITIESSDSLAGDAVVIDGLDPAVLVRPKVRRLRFHRVCLDSSRMMQMYKEDSHAQWYDACTWFQSAGWTYSPPMDLVPVRNQGYGGLFVTDSLAHDCLFGFPNANLVRGSTVRHCSGDCFQNSLAVINCAMEEVDDTVSDWHADLFQYYGDLENVIVFNCTGKNVKATQNFFLDPYQSTFTNMFFVNVAIEDVAGNPPFTQLASPCKHVLFSHVSIPGQQAILRDDFSGGSQFVATDVLFVNCVLGGLRRGAWSSPGIPAGVGASHCHLADGTAQGDAPTVGAVAVSVADSGAIEYSGPAAGTLEGSALGIPFGLGIGSPNRGARKLPCSP